MNLTNHAIARMSQRGVPAVVLETVIRFGDRQIFVGGGCVSISVSRDLACELARDGQISPSMVDRLANVFVVIANDNDAVVTVVHPNNRKSARSYLKPDGYEPPSRGRRPY